jgi:hypothetical protein
LTASEVDDEVFLFRRRSLDETGKRAKRPDWDGAFQAWIVKGKRFRTESVGKAPATSAVRPEIDWNLYVSRYRMNGSWMPALGPAPDHAGCKAPLDVLYRNGFGRTAGAA